jgi:hypothetical protein
MRALTCGVLIAGLVAGHVARADGLTAPPPPRAPASEQPLGWALGATAVFFGIMGGILAGYGEEIASSGHTVGYMPAPVLVARDRDSYRGFGYASIALSAASLVGCVVTFSLAARRAAKSTTRTP